MNARIERALAGRLDVARLTDKLVRELSVDCTRTALDDWADQVSRLSDAEVEIGPTAERLPALARTHILTLDQALRSYVIHSEQETGRGARAWHHGA